MVREVLERRGSPLLLPLVRSKCRCILHSSLEASSYLLVFPFPPCHRGGFDALDEVVFFPKDSPTKLELTSLDIKFKESI